MSPIDDFFLMRIDFLLALGALGFTFWCKRKENELSRKKENLESMLRIQKIYDKSDNKTRVELTKTIYKIIAINAKNVKEKLKKIEKLKQQLKLSENEKNIDNLTFKILKKINEHSLRLVPQLDELKELIEEFENLFLLIHLQVKEEQDLKPVPQLDELKELIEEFEKVNQQKDGQEKEDHKEKESYPQLLIFAGLYAIIGGLAITQAVTIFSEPDKNQYIAYAHTLEGFIMLASSKHSFVIASFFPIAILFIHCGIIFLSTDARKIIRVGNKVVFFISALLLFLEVVVVFYAANSIDNILNFASWIALLMAIDIGWVILNITKNIDMLFQWIHLDATMLVFLLTMLFIFHSVSQVTYEVYAYVLVIFLVRTIFDYKMGWNDVWGKFDVSDKLG